MTSDGPETPIILDEKAVCALLPHLDTASELRSLFSQLGKRLAVQPSQTVTDFPAGKGDYITYLGVLAEMGVFGTKLSPYIVTDTKPIITAWTSLMSMETGQPLLWCDSGVLTTERTAGTTALAVDLLAPKNAQTLCIIGSGAVALAHLRHVVGLRDWKDIRVFSPSLKDDPGKQEIWRGHTQHLSFCESANDAVHQADVVMLCTSSETPVIDTTRIGKPSLVTSISTNAANAHEVPPTFLNTADVFCDYAKTTPSSAGEMKLATSEHGWDASHVMGDLPQLVCGTCAMPDFSKPVFFRSIGLGLEDIAMAHGIWKLAQTSKPPAAE
jgi:L-arginine dehydrogenase